MSGARLNLVRTEILETAEDLAQHSLATNYDRFDEVELVTPAGDPAVMPSAIGWNDADIRYEYITGGVGHSARRARHQIQFAVDYLDNATRAKLERWQRDRALVWFNPGFGRTTEIAYRPLVGAGSTYSDGSTTLKDLTGRYSLTTAGDSTNTMVWDQALRVMRGPFDGTSPRRVFPSAYGAVQCFERSHTNRHRPGYPINSTEGNGATDSGWNKDGANSADITFGISTTGGFAFGHEDCRDALHVTTTYAASRTRNVSASQQWDSGDAEYHYGFTGSGRATVSLWVRGKFSESAQLVFQQLGGSSDTITLGGLDLSEWTRLSLSVYSADWTTGRPLLYFNLSTGATADQSDFYIGPCMVCHGSGELQQTTPEWAEYNTAVSSGYMQAASFVFPSTGTVISSFYLPEGVDYSSAGLIGSSAGPGLLQVSAGAAIRFYVTASSYLTASNTLIEGAVNTIAATWASGGAAALYVNGVLVDSDASGGRENDLADAAVTLYLGTGGGHAAWPLQFMSARIDSRVYTEAEVAQLDASLRDPVANMVSVQARGRKYRIVSLPSTPRNQIGGAQWIGNLVLEEWEYDSNLADVTTAEVM